MKKNISKRQKAYIILVIWEFIFLYRKSKSLNARLYMLLVICNFLEKEGIKLNWGTLPIQSEQLLNKFYSIILSLENEVGLLTTEDSFDVHPLSEIKAWDMLDKPVREGLALFIYKACEPGLQKCRLGKMMYDENSTLVDKSLLKCVQKLYGKHKKIYSSNIISFDFIKT